MVLIAILELNLMIRLLDFQLKVELRLCHTKSEIFVARKKI